MLYYYSMYSGRQLSFRKWLQKKIIIITTLKGFFYILSSLLSAIIKKIVPYEF